MNELSPEQRENTKQRILYDARLIQNEAHITEMGRLAITNRQLEQAIRLGDPLSQKFLPEQITSEELTERLDEPLESALRRFYPGEERMWRALYRDGIETARDVLVIGKSRILDVQNIGPKSGKLIEEFLVETIPGLPWQFDPSVEYIASFCDQLDQVNAHVLERYSHVSHYQLPHHKLTIKAILSTPEHDWVSRIIGSRNYYDRQEAIDNTKRVYVDAKQFATQFTKAIKG